jgi:predicted lactoylglutathione lyase
VGAAAIAGVESGIPAASTPKSLWAIFVGSKAEVDSTFARATEAGAKITSPVRDRDGGLYSGYFADPEGNGWEIVWSPHMPLDADGALTLG